MPVRHGIVPMSVGNTETSLRIRCAFSRACWSVKSDVRRFSRFVTTGATGGPALPRFANLPNSLHPPFYPGSWIGLASGKPQRRRRAESGRRVRDRFAHISNLRSPRRPPNQPRTPRGEPRSASEVGSETLGRSSPDDIAALVVVPAVSYTHESK